MKFTNTITNNNNNVLLSYIFEFIEFNNKIWYFLYCVKIEKNKIL